MWYEGLMNKGQIRSLPICHDFVIHFHYKIATAYFKVVTAIVNSFYCKSKMLGLIKMLML